MGWKKAKNDPRSLQYYSTAYDIFEEVTRDLRKERGENWYGDPKKIKLAYKIEEFYSPVLINICLKWLTSLQERGLYDQQADVLKKMSCLEPAWLMYDLRSRWFKKCWTAEAEADHSQFIMVLTRGQH